MTLVSSKEVQRIFLTTNTQTLSPSNNIDIIVSPEFYWVRKFEIPVKSEAQARHVLPTLFEDIIDEFSTLTYQVRKLEENQYLCFAYNNKKIFDAIKKLDLPISNISSIYFAQNECQNFKSFEIDKQKYMYTNEDILVKVPNKLIEDAIPLTKVINNIKLSSHKLQIKLYNDVLSPKFYNTLFIVLGILIITNFFRYFNYSSEITNLENNMEMIKNKSKTPTSMLQMNSILKKNDLKINEEKNKREAISYIFTNRKFDLKSLYFDKGIIHLEYLSSDKKEVEKYLLKKFKNISIKQNAFSLKVDVKL